MRYLRSAIARVSGLLSRHSSNDELREEMEAHLEMETAENIRRGMTPAEARRRAVLASGGLTQALEAVREQQTLPWVEAIAADVRYAARCLRRSPAFTLIVIVTLALGIGANTAIFSVVRGVLLKPLPHRDGDRLVYLRHSMDGPGGANLNFSVPEVRDLRSGAPSLESIAEYSPWTVVLHREDGSVRLDVGLVTGNYFEVMGLTPVLGRLTDADNDGAGVPSVLVLTHDYWLRGFGGDMSIIGRQLPVDGTTATIIGVVEPAPFFPDRVDAFLNMAVSDHHVSAMMVEGRTHRMTEVVARLAPGAGLDRARTEIDATYARMRAEHSDAYDAAAHPRITATPFREAIGERARLTLWLLMGAAAFVLIIAVANVTNLTLMRAVQREQELVVRVGLGAGVARLRRLLLAENLLLTIAGAGLGLAVAVAGVRLLITVADRYTPRASEIQLDLAVLGFALAIAVAAALLLSYVVSLPREGRFTASVIAGGRRVSRSIRSNRLQRALVVVQVAASVVLLAGAGLLTRTTLQLASVRTGLLTEEVLSMQVTLATPSELLSDPAADGVTKERFEEMLRQLAALPGVLHVGLGSTAPLRSSSVRLELQAEGVEPLPGEPLPRAEFRTADPDYFRAAGIPLLRGREFTRTDQPGSERVVIINQALAGLLFRGEDPLGQRIAWTGDILRFAPISGDWRTVVGVTGNTQDGGPDAAPRSVAFMPVAQELAVGSTIVIRAERNVEALIAPATQIVRRVAPRAPIERVATIAQVRDQAISPRRLNAVLISAFGILSIIVAAIGIAGVLAFSVGARTSEIGVRMSLGADPARVLRMVLRDGGVLIGVGLLLGLIGSAAAARVLENLLFGVPPHDPVTFAAVAVVMLLIGLVACWLPARRAAGIDPAIAMRT